MKLLRLLMCHLRADMFSFLLGRYLPVVAAEVLGPQSVGSHRPWDPQTFGLLCGLMGWTSLTVGPDGDPLKHEVPGPGALATDDA